LRLLRAKSDYQVFLSEASTPGDDNADKQLEMTGTVDR
jgi:hypothetical protein